MNRWLRFSGIVGSVLLGFVVIVGGAAGALREPSLIFQHPLLAIHLFLGVLLVVLWFATVGVKNVGSAGEVVTGRGARFGANAVVSSAVVIGLLLVANFLAVHYNKRADLTEQGVYSLSPQSKALVERLNKPLTLAVLIKLEGLNDFATRELLELYRYANPEKVKVEYIDPNAKPHLLEKYGFKRGNLLYVGYGEGNSVQESRLNDIKEEDITNAVLKLSRGEAKKIYYVEGHGEPSRTDHQEEGVTKFMSALGDEHYTVEGLLLAEKPSVPEDAAAVILASPKKPLLEHERELLVKYVEQGGRLFLFHDPRTTSDVKDIAARFGMKVEDTIVIDQVQRLFSAPQLGVEPVARSFGAHPITAGFGPENLVIFSLASNLSRGGQPDTTSTYTDLVKSGPAAWGETNIGLLFSEPPQAQLDESDLKGPLTLAMAYEKKIGEAPKSESADAPAFQRTAKVVLFGDSDWVLNYRMEQWGNRDLATSAINWLVGESGGVTIQPRSMRVSTAVMDRGTFLTILYASLIVPELIILTGLLVWWRRRTAFA